MDEGRWHNEGLTGGGLMAGARREFDLAVEVSMSTRAIQGLMLTVALALIAGCQPAPTDSLAGLSAEQQKQKLYDQIESRYEIPQAHYKLGQIFEREGELRKAGYHYETAADFKPYFWAAQAASVKVYLDARMPDKPARLHGKWATMASSADDCLSLAKAYELVGLTAQAKAMYDKAENVAPKSAKAFKASGYFYLAGKDKATAETKFRRSFELDPYQSDVSAELGKMGVIVQSPRKK
jgi:tetratricopeptide (TPR) repeat protein